MADEEAREAREARGAVVAYRTVRKAGNLAYISVGGMIKGSPMRPGDTVRVTLEPCGEGEE